MALSGKLTKRLVENLGAGRHGDGNGLYLVVDPSGARRWIVRVVVKGQKSKNGAPLRTDFGLGGADIVTLNQARERALEYRRMAKQGLNPRCTEFFGLTVSHGTQAEIVWSCWESFCNLVEDRPELTVFFDTVSLNYSQKLPEWIGSLYVCGTYFIPTRVLTFEKFIPSDGRFFMLKLLRYANEHNCGA